MVCVCVVCVCVCAEIQLNLKLETIGALNSLYISELSACLPNNIPYTPLGLDNYLPNYCMCYCKDFRTKRCAHYLAKPSCLTV